MHAIDRQLALLVALNSVVVPSPTGSVPSSFLQSLPAANATAVTAAAAAATAVSIAVCIYSTAVHRAASISVMSIVWGAVKR